MVWKQNKKVKMTAKYRRKLNEPRKTSHSSINKRRSGPRGKYCRGTYRIHFWEVELMKQRRYNPQQEAKSLERSLHK